MFSHPLVLPLKPQYLPHRQTRLSLEHKTVVALNNKLYKSQAFPPYALSTLHC